MTACPIADPARERILAFLDDERPSTPCLVVDLDTVAERFALMREAFPGARIFYAVKANPTAAVLRRLVGLGAEFEVASVGEVEHCLAAGAAPRSIAFTNTIKKRADIAHAHALGVRLFTFDSQTDVEHLAAYAPGASVVCRLLVEPPGARTPFGRKFGCSAAVAEQLLRHASALGLDAHGLSFHVGSQQLDPGAWETGIAACGTVLRALARDGIRLRLLDLGGGFPAAYSEPVPPLSHYREAIEAALDRHLDTVERPRLAVEPGRAIVGEAGMIRSEVVLVSSRDGGDPARWVYLDVGRYGGLAEAEGEAIVYRLATSRDGEPTGRVVLAGPTADGDDVIYQRTPVHLPHGLRAGDHVDILNAGAYTASYAAVAFNGLPPLPTYCVGEEDAA